MYTRSPACQLVPAPPAGVFQVPSGAKVTTVLAWAWVVLPPTCQPVACHGPVSHAGWLVRASGEIAAVFPAQAANHRLPRAGRERQARGDDDESQERTACHGALLLVLRAGPDGDPHHGR